MEAVKEVKTISQLASEYELHPPQINSWKKQLLTGVKNIFTKDKGKQAQEQNEQEAERYKQIGRLKMEYEPAQESTLNLKLMRVIDDLLIVYPNQVWSTDITYIPMPQGFMYLVAIIDWHSRYVVAWEISNTMDGHFCRAALRRAVAQSKPEIFNTDQGSQFTAQGLHRLSQRSLDHHLNGWSGAGPGQHFRGTALANREV